MIWLHISRCGNISSKHSFFTWKKSVWVKSLMPTLTTSSSTQFNFLASKTCPVGFWTLLIWIPRLHLRPKPFGKPTPIPALTPWLPTPPPSRPRSRLLPTRKDQICSKQNPIIRFWKVRLPTHPIKPPTNVTFHSPTSKPPPLLSLLSASTYRTRTTSKCRPIFFQRIQCSSTSHRFWSTTTPTCTSHSLNFIAISWTNTFHGSNRPSKTSCSKSRRSSRVWKMNLLQIPPFWRKWVKQARHWAHTSAR